MLKTEKEAEAERLSVKCAVGIIFDREMKILISKRISNKIGGGLWEFPGGKIEENETNEQGLIRELEEEIGITPTQFEAFMKVNFKYPEFEVFLEVFLVHQFKGKPRGVEGQTIAWVTIKDLDKYSFLEGNATIIQSLKKLTSKN